MRRVMPDFRYGPVEIYLLALDEEEAPPGTLADLADLLCSGMVRLLDLVAVRKGRAGEVAVLDRAARDRLGLDTAPDPVTEGLIGQEDLVELAAPLACGSSAAVLALELRFELLLADRLGRGRAKVLRQARIPAPVVNALIDLYDPDLSEPLPSEPVLPAPDILEPAPHELLLETHALHDHPEGRSS